MATAGGVGDSGAQNPAQLTAVILTLNEARHIASCLESLAWADQRLVFDAYSQDETATLAADAGASVLRNEFHNFAQQRNAALRAIQTDWVLFVDADERGTPALGAEIRRVIAQQSNAAWYVPRHNYIFGKLTTGAGWYPDYQLRLFRHGKVRYERAVHEVAQVDGETGYLENVLVHYNYESVDQFHRKQRQYSDLEAGLLLQEGARPKGYTPVTQALRQFWWRFVTLKGFRDGIHGLHLSLLMAYYEWLKYRKLAGLAAQTGVLSEP